MAQEFLTGKDGSVTLGGQERNVTGWKFDPQCEILETTHSGSGGFRTYEPGPKGATGEFTMNCAVAGLPAGLMPGTEVSGSLKLKSGMTITIGRALISGMPIQSEVKGLITLTVSFTVSGSFNVYA